MEFRFDVRPLFKTHIIRVTNNLVPQGFTGDRRSILDAIAKISEVINVVGESSAKAQGLSKPVTTAQKLRNSDHIVYLLAEETGNNGCVTGLLKIGTKNLYVFDENGDTKMIPAMCVLDFYIHESRQRAGLGKEMFEVMLKRENVHPIKLAIDRPSDKFLAFLRKHYGLQRTIPQMNNFVIYEGFFSDQTNGNAVDNAIETSDIKITASPNTTLFGAQSWNDDQPKRSKHDVSKLSHLPFVQTQPMGRFGAKKPTGSMAEIIHSSSTKVANPPPHSERSDWVADNQSKRCSINGNADADEPDSVPANDEIESKIDYSKSVEDIIADIENVELHAMNDATNGSIDANESIRSREVKFDNAVPSPQSTSIRKPMQPNKQHTGLKNISFNVGAAVTPGNKMEFEQEEPESFGVVKLNRPIGKSPNPDSDAMSTISSINSEGITDQGYFDLKFYHNKLW